MESHGMSPKCWKVMENKANGCRI